MQELTPQQIKKLKKIASVIDKGNIAIAEYLLELEDKLDEEIPQIKDIINRLKGDKGDMPSKDELLALIKPLIPAIPKVVNGKDYVLTSEDKKEIANSIKVPIVEKVVEKIVEKREIVKEKPIITQVVKEVALYETAEDTRNKLEALVGEDKLRIEAIRNLREELDETKSELKTQIKGWGAHPLRIEQGGSVKTKVARTLNFIGATVAQTGAGVTNITITGGGGGGTWGSITGTVTDQTDLVTYITGLPVSTFTNDMGYLVSGDNVSSLTNDAGYLTSESQTLQDVTNLGASTTVQSTFSGGLISPDIFGTTVANGNLNLDGTSSGTKATSYIHLQGSGGRVAIGSSTIPAGVEAAGASLFANGQNYAIIGSSNTTNATRKFTRWGAAHFTNAEEPLTMMIGDSVTGSTADMYIGGGTGLGNSFQTIRFFTGANATTLTGTERMIIGSTGNVGIGTSSPSTPLSFGTSIGEKVRIYDSGVTSTSYGMGTAAGDLQTYIGTGIFTWRTGGYNGTVRMVYNQSNLRFGINVASTPLTTFHVDGSGLFGNLTSLSTATPVNVSFGGTFGSGTIGSNANLKWSLYDTGVASSKYGIGMSSGYMEFQTGTGGGMAFFVNNGTEVMRILSTNQIGIGTTSPNTNSILDLVSTTRAFMPPRMTTAQRDAIASPTAGMMIYNTTTNVMDFYNGSVWGAI